MNKLIGCCMKKQEANTLGARILQSLLGAVAGFLVTVVLMLLLALVAEIANMPASALPISNTVIKLISIFLGTMVTMRSINSRGILFGALTGIFYILLTSLVFTLINTGMFAFSGLWLDLLLGAVMGAVSGILLVNLKRK